MFLWSLNIKNKDWVPNIVVHYVESGSLEGWWLISLLSSERLVLGIVGMVGMSHLEGWWIVSVLSWVFWAWKITSRAWKLKKIKKSVIQKFEPEKSVSPISEPSLMSMEQMSLKRRTIVFRRRNCGMSTVTWHIVAACVLFRDVRGQDEKLMIHTGFNHCINLSSSGLIT